MSNAHRARFRAAQERAQRHRDDSRWIAAVSATPADPSPVRRVALVARRGDGDREVRLSDVDGRALGAPRRIESAADEGS